MFCDSHPAPQEDIGTDKVDLDADQVALARQSRNRLINAIADGFAGTQLLFPKVSGEKGSSLRNTCSGEEH